MERTFRVQLQDAFSKHVLLTTSKYEKGVKPIGDIEEPRYDNAMEIIMIMLNMIMC